MIMKTRTNKRSKTVTPSFSTALHYPFKKPARLCYIFWFFLPIIGWFFLIGYFAHVVQSFIEGKYHALPPARPFFETFGTGFFLFLKFIPLAIVLGIIEFTLTSMTPSLAILLVPIIYLFFVPFLVVHFWYHKTVRSSFAWGTFRYVFTHIGDYVISALKSLALVLIFMVTNIFFLVILYVLTKSDPGYADPSIITIPWGLLIYSIFTGIATVILIAAAGFTEYIYIADFYRRRVVQ